MKIEDWWLKIDDCQVTCAKGSFNNNFFKMNEFPNHALKKASLLSKNELAFASSFLNRDQQPFTICSDRLRLGSRHMQFTKWSVHKTIWQSARFPEYQVSLAKDSLGTTLRMLLSKWTNFKLRNLKIYVSAMIVRERLSYTCGPIILSVWLSFRFKFDDHYYCVNMSSEGHMI